MKQLHIYLDTSVLGGCFDDEFSHASCKLFDEIRNGKFIPVISTITIRELDRAPTRVQELTKDIQDKGLQIVKRSIEIISLRDAYLEAGVVSSASLADAEHIATATVANADLIVSWNFKHIVNFQRIRGYHAVNLVWGYHPISIHSPNEVIEP